MTRGEWQVWTDTARKGVNRSVVTFRRGAKAAIRAAEAIALDYDAERVTVEHDGKQAGVFSAGILWVQVSDATLARAIEVTR